MGWRYRKSINLGGGFRINLSKSGIGYSWGVPGYRITKTANGKTRKTYSIPGTGISYVENDRNNKFQGNSQNINYDYNTKLITGDTTYYRNTNLDRMGQNDEILMQINKVKNINTIANVCIASIVFLFIGVILKFLIAKKWKINLKYEFDEYSEKKYESLNCFFKEISKNKKIWQINTSTKVYNTKYNSGAGNNVTRNTSLITKSMPWYIENNIDVYGLKLQNEKIYFTPDRIIIFRGMRRVSGRSYKDLEAGFSTTNFVETEMIPKDARICSYTWQYVNKNGGPDRRFSNNRQMPVCKYGEITLKTNDGINILLNCSNVDSMLQIQDAFERFMEYNNQEIRSNECYYNIEYKADEKMDYDFIEKENEITNNDKDFEVKQGENVDKNNDKEIEKHSDSEDVTSNNGLEENKEGQSKKYINVWKILCKIISNICMIFSIFIMIGSISEKLYLSTFVWAIISVLFISKIKNILENQYNVKSKVINAIRVILVLVGIIILGISLPMSFEGTWKSEDNEVVILNDGVINIILSDGSYLEGKYNYSLYDGTNYKIEATVTKKDELDEKEVRYNYEKDGNKIKFYSVENGAPSKFYLPEKKISSYEYLTE